jgi:predicted RNA-binding protein Jag
MIWWCEHIYHKKCFSQLLKYDKEAKCPICNNEILNVLDLNKQYEVLSYFELKTEMRKLQEEAMKQIEMEQYVNEIAQDMDDFFDINVKKEDKKIINQ